MHTRGKLKLHRLIAGIILMLGLVLMASKIYVDDEPGALPLLMIVVAVAWFFISRQLLRSRYK